jgi:phosphohistidine phosphatase SixA
VWIQDTIEAEGQDVLLVGHMPHLPALARSLASIIDFPLHGMIALERSGEGGYIERWRARPPM